ncbi:MAG: hypothetical protein M1835_005812 [Candelina submexicana]|nr:MAG: hypothetical protein M1835_005812 [Candelina submexicana]
MATRQTEWYTFYSKKDLQEALSERSQYFAARWNKTQLRKRLMDHDDEMSSQPDLPPFPILELPLELRKMIYSFILASGDEICVAVDDPYRSGLLPELSGGHPEQRRLEVQPYDPVWEYSLNMSRPGAELKEKDAYHTRFSLLRSNRQIYHEAREYVVKNNTIRFDLGAGSFYAHRIAERDVWTKDPYQWWRSVSLEWSFSEVQVNCSKNCSQQVLMLRRREGRISEHSHPRLSLEHCPGFFVPAPFHVSEPRDIKAVLDFPLEFHRNHGSWYLWLSCFRTVMLIFVKNVLEPIKVLHKLEVRFHVKLEGNFGFDPATFPYHEMERIFEPLGTLRGLKEVTFGEGMMLTDEFQNHLKKLMTSPNPKAPKVEEKSVAATESSNLAVGGTSLFGGGSSSSALGNSK